MAHFRLKKLTAGFTLIELLVVVAIISLLASIIIASLATAKQKARDAVRQSDLRQLHNALEIYYLNKGYYPPANCGVGGTGGVSSDGCNPDITWNKTGYPIWEALVNTPPAIISALPIDPINDRIHNYKYYARPVGCDNSSVFCSSFELKTQLETAKDINQCWKDDSSGVGLTNCPAS